MFFVYGDEDDMTHWRLLQSAAFGEVEDGNWARFFSDLADVYELAFATAAGGAIASIIACVENYNPAVCGSILDYFAVAASFYIAERNIRTVHQQEFSATMHNAPPGEEDGVVPIWSQAPTSAFPTVPFGNFKRAEGANHLEERMHQLTLDRVDEALKDLEK